MNQEQETNQLRTAVAILRITLGVIFLATWYDNLQGGLYTAEGLTGFFNWLFDPQNGNGSSLGWYQAILNNVFIPIAGPFAMFQLITELVLGLTLLFGILTRLSGIFAMLFFANLFLAYFGGHEWIWVYVLLFVSALSVTLGAGGRKWGLDQLFIKRRGEPRLAFLW